MYFNFVFVVSKCVIIIRDVFFVILRDFNESNKCVVILYFNLEWFFYDKYNYCGCCNFC